MVNVSKRAKTQESEQGHPPKLGLILLRIFIHNSNLLYTKFSCNSNPGHQIITLFPLLLASIAQLMWYVLILQWLLWEFRSLRELKISVKWPQGQYSWDLWKSHVKSNINIYSGTLMKWWRLDCPSITTLIVICIYNVIICIWP